MKCRLQCKVRCGIRTKLFIFAGVVSASQNLGPQSLSAIVRKEGLGALMVGAGPRVVRRTLQVNCLYFSARCADVLMNWNHFEPCVGCACITGTPLMFRRPSHLQYVMLWIWPNGNVWMVSQCSPGIDCRFFSGSTLDLDVQSYFKSLLQSAHSFWHTYKEQAPTLAGLLRDVFTVFLTEFNFSCLTSQMWICDVCLVATALACSWGYWSTRQAFQYIHKSIELPICDFACVFQMAMTWSMYEEIVKVIDDITVGKQTNEWN